MPAVVLARSRRPSFRTALVKLANVDDCVRELRERAAIQHSTVRNAYRSHCVLACLEPLALLQLTNAFKEAFFLMQVPHPRPRPLRVPG